VQTCTQCGKENPDGFQFCGFCTAPLAEMRPAREQRKVVTVVFCDVTGSTELGERLDPEALRALLARYFTRMKAIVERHGGTVEKFIGDAVMAVFGVPVVHEDDALRAVRAAAEMREAFPELEVQGRIGIATGEVVTGTAERLATGDAVNVAARLEQAAAPGDVLMGEPTFALVRGAVLAYALEPLEVKGKTEKVPAFRLLAVLGEAMRRNEAPMVGREREQRLLADAWERVTSERSCHLFTILGAAGVGKSRLAAEFLALLEDALVVGGRCLPYGEGITYWPVVEVIKQLPEAETDPVAAKTIEALVGDRDLVTSSEEIAWAFRKRLEAAASERPLVCVFDDLHWGELTFLDLVEHVAELARDAPVLLLAMARPELLDRRGGWGGGKVNATSVLLEPLAPEETERLIEWLADLDPKLRGRISEAAEGNPLFVEEMVALVQASGAGDVTVPPTIQALLAARLDQLDPRERDVLQRGSIEGRVFHHGSVEALAPGEPRLRERLTSLVRKELLRPGVPEFPGEDAYRFRHLLIRDAAYDSLPKATRAEFHERFAAWLERYGAVLVDVDGLVGYHLEQACQYRVQLGSADDDATRALARSAATRLGAAGRRAFLRSDPSAGVNLISRAAALLAPDDPVRVELIPNVRIMQGVSEDLAWADDILGGALESGDEQLRARALVQRGLLRLFTERQVAPDELIATAEEAVAIQAKHGDDLGLARSWRLIGQAHYLARRAGPSADAAEHALVHARGAGDPLEVKEIVEWLAVGLLLGPAPAPEGLRRLESLHADAVHDGFLEVTLSSIRANLAAMCDRPADAEELFARARRAVTEGDLHRNGFFAIQLGLAAPAFGDPAAAERELRATYDALDEVGEKTNNCSVAAMLARMLCARGAYVEAEHYTRMSEEAARPNDVLAQILWRSTRARALASQGELADAERFACEAVDFAERSDFVNAHADALLDLAEVLELGGKTGDAADRVKQALALYERKGNLLMSNRARARLAALVEASASREPSP
jgi:class 3 adenylate cyclase/tetratricopeptide (TPR) repeat protein